MSTGLFRLAIAGVVSLGLTAGSGTFAASCSGSPAAEAFDVQGLKSELMVTALSCKAQDRYNAVMEKFRTKLLAEEQRLNTYFRTTYGKRAQIEHDDYITQLANVQSEKSLQSGTIFCDQRIGMFDEVIALDDEHDLSKYALAKDITQPATFETCAAPAVEKTTETRSRARRRTARKA
ncbi:hypothetical protein AA0242T_0052 [Acetobacter aceti NRIC 0242]|uniref:Uncharacterized protein n=1 Tax=Acetobacter aceti NBRC 14818 TaxID=887700 RepID=A0AB33IA46_ACEAC|nr:hypothetical protein [Acetobacter aceti]TCS35480.1 hypothetical protein EDC15_101279 [Acetobacter aceti NBRC 14818]BCK75133.1 hypothetical protein EMQ_0739 [Acetobacter aceti NBRC 14818]GAN57577.1 hypothetical protein Abac_017_278 [Acetobacter aceti NBRC 14818]GBO79350.1 hypothetical protein AA0242T_0052 [Acetobacter aceti NRIC 0242]